MAAKNMPAPLRNSRFYCEHCGHEVPFNASICPHCKKTFDAVKCPICQFSGHPDKFLNGCPMCGYLSTTSTIGRRRKSEIEEAVRGRKPRRKQELFLPFMIFLLLAMAAGIVYVLWTRNS